MAAMFPKFLSLHSKIHLSDFTTLGRERLQIERGEPALIQKICSQLGVQFGNILLKETKKLGLIWKRVEGEAEI